MHVAPPASSTERATVRPGARTAMDASRAGGGHRGVVTSRRSSPLQVMQDVHALPPAYCPAMGVQFWLGVQANNLNSQNSLNRCTCTRRL